MRGRTGQKFVQIEGLAEIPCGMALLHGRYSGCLSGHDDHRDVDSPGAHRLNDVHPCYGAEAQIDEHQVRWVGQDRGGGRGAISDADGGIAVFGQCLDDEVDTRRVTVGDEDGATRSHDDLTSCRRVCDLAQWAYAAAHN